MKNRVAVIVPSLLLLAGLLCFPKTPLRKENRSEIIAYSLGRYAREGGMWVMKPDGTERHRITADGFEATISPNYTKMVFASRVATGNAFSARGQVPDLYSIGVDGRNRQTLTEPDYRYASSSPSFNQNGQTIVFQRTEQDGIFTNSALVVMNVDSLKTTELSDLKSNDSNYEPSFSPINDQIVFVSGIRYTEMGRKTSVYLTNTNGSFVRRLTWQGDGKQGSRDDSSPSFSPDGRRIVFRRTETTTKSTNSIYIIDSDGGNLQKLCEQATSPQFTPDGQRIAYIHREEIWMTNRVGKRIARDYRAQLWTIKPNGSDQKPLPNAPSNIVSFDWR